MILKKISSILEQNVKCYYHFSMNTKLGYDRKDAFQKIDKELIYE